MKHGLRGLCLLAFVSTAITVIMESTEESILSNEDSTSFNEAFGACLARKEFGTLECANRGALSTLQSLNHKDDLEFGNVHLERADGQSRELLDWDYDPKDFGNIVKATTKLIERRSFKWNLDSVYPGLQLRAGPMLNGNGIMEFVINERATTFGDRQAGPGKELFSCQIFSIVVPNRDNDVTWNLSNESLRKTFKLVSIFFYRSLTNLENYFNVVSIV